MQYHHPITAPQLHQQASSLLQRHLRLPDHGPKTTAPVLFAILFWAAARLASIAAACRELRDAPCDQAVRNALLATLPDFYELQRRLNRALRGSLPKALTRRRHVVAIDLVLKPYYGLPHSDAAEIYRGACKAGTHQFHAYATAYVICKGCRCTLALRAVHHSDPWDDVVKDLLRQVRQAGVAIKLVLVDRGFYSVAVIRYLQRAKYAFVMPVIRRGRKPQHPDGPSGTWVYSTWRRSGWDRYTLEDRQHNHVTVNICVSYVAVPTTRPSARKSKKPRPRRWVYAYWGIAPKTVRWVRETYRQRFGIESSYRQLNQALIRTSTRDPLLRLLFVGLALVLRNVYVWVHWEVLAYRRRGYRVVDLDQLPLTNVLRWLAEVTEALLGVNLQRQAQRPIPIMT